MAWAETEGRETERVYDRFARVYDLVFGAVCFPGRRRAAERLHCTAGERVLEIGVGTGLAAGLYPPETRVVGVDISREMLLRAVHRLGEAGGVSWSLARMDAHRLGFPDGSFDKVVASYVISVLPDPVRGVEEMKRVCKPGGDLIVLNHFHSSHPLVRWFERRLDPLAAHLGWSTTLDLEGLVRATGLEVLEVERVNAFGYWRLIHARNAATAVETAAGYV